MASTAGQCCFSRTVILGRLPAIWGGTAMLDDSTAMGASQAPDSDETLASLGPQLISTARNLPATIGGYRIIRLLGEGGMGSVYEAEQDQPRRHVALKVIRAAWA